jgi:hypothetical protein
MKHLNIKHYIWAVSVLSIIVWAVLLIINRIEINATIDIIWKAIRLIPTVVTIDLLTWYIFSKWAWKWQIFQKWLVPYPFIQGTWRGAIKTTWDETEMNIPIYLVINQSFISLSCVMISKEMKSKSYSTDFIIDQDNQTISIIYSYISETKISVRERSPIHNGTAILEIISEKERKMVGKYWTDRKTIGEIELKYSCHDLLKEYPRDIET